MKQCILYLFASIFFNNCFAYNYLKKGDTLYVWAPSGLNLRSSDNSDSEVIATIPYGKSVVLDTLDGRDHYIELVKAKNYGNQNYPSYDLKGKFLKVRYKEVTGFIFSGYLSSYPTIKIKDDWKEYPFSERLEEYSQRTFGIVKQVGEINQSGNGFETIIYDGGVTLEHEQHTSSWSYVFVFPSLTLNEGVLMLNILWNLERLSEIAEIGPLIKKEYDYLLFGEGLENCEMRQINKTLVMHFSGGN